MKIFRGGRKTRKSLFNSPLDTTMLTSGNVKKFNTGSLNKVDISESGANTYDIVYQIPDNVEAVFLHVNLNARGRKYNRNYYKLIMNGIENEFYLAAIGLVNTGTDCDLYCDNHLLLDKSVKEVVIRFMAGGGTNNKNTLTGFIEISGWY